MNDTDRRALALAEINKMEKDLIAAQQEIVALKRSNDRCEDRIEILVRDRDEYRRAAKIYRDKLVELATSMANIGLMTIKAQEIMRTVEEMIEETPEETAAEQESARQMAAKLAPDVSVRPKATNKLVGAPAEGSGRGNDGGP